MFKRQSISFVRLNKIVSLAGIELQSPRMLLRDANHSATQNFILVFSFNYNF